MDEYLIGRFFEPQSFENMSDHEFISQLKKLMSEKSHSESHDSDLYEKARVKESLESPSRYGYENIGYKDLKSYHGYIMSSNEFMSRIRNMFDGMSEEEKERFWNELIGSHKDSSGEHFNESYAKYEVSKMCHIEGGRKHVGERFNMKKAQEVYEIYKGCISQSTTVADIYVAINLGYHSTVQLFRAWFGDDIDHKVIEFSINFWFKGGDDRDGKIWRYFKNK